MTKKVATTIKIYPAQRTKLEGLVEARKNNHSLIKTQETIVADLIDKAYKKEIK